MDNTIENIDLLIKLLKLYKKYVKESINWTNKRYLASKNNDSIRRKQTINAKWANCAEMRDRYKNACEKQILVLFPILQE